MGTYLSSKLRDMGDGMLLHWCPGCKTRHYVDTLEPNGSGAIWTWDGNAEAPTFSPSVHIRGRCHYFIRAGMIEFLGDCTHDHAGMTVPLPDIPGWLQERASP